MAQQQAVNKFVLGSKELEGKNAEFQYDKGWYSITDIVGEERNVIYKSRNAQEAYMKWNVYIGRKKERPVPENRKNDNGADRGEHRDSGRNNQREKRNNRDNREIREERGAGRIATTAISEITAIAGTEIGAETVTAMSLRMEREIIRIVADVAIIAETVSRTHNRIWNKNDKSTGEGLCF